MFILETGRISGRQVSLLLIVIIVSTSLLFPPTIVARLAQQDAWLSVVLALPVGLLVGALVVGLSRRFPGLTLVEYSQVVLGPWAGRVIGLAFVWWFLHVAAIVAREMGTLLTTAVFDQTPIEVIIFLMVMLTASAVRNGIETLARSNDFMFWIQLGSYLAVLALVTPQVIPQNLTPVLERGIGPILQGSWVAGSWMGEVVIVSMFLPFLDYQRQAGASIIWALGLVTAITAGSIAMALFVLGPATAGRLTVAVLTLARLVSVGRIIERMDAIIMVIWVLGLFIKISAFYYAASLGLAQILSLRDFRPVVLPLGLLIAVLSLLLFRNTPQLVDFLGFAWPSYSVTIFEVGLPALLLALALARGLGGENL